MQLSGCNEREIDMPNNVEILNPIYGASAKAGPLQSLDLPALDASSSFRLAFMSNEKVGTGDLLLQVEDRLRALFPNAEFRNFSKNNSARPAPHETLEQVRDFADLVVYSTAD